MSKRHRRILEAVFRDPVSATIVWSEVEKMMVHYGATVEELDGSAIMVRLNGFSGWFHRPHPQKEAPRGMIRRLRRFLTTAGVAP
jgi:hypothetical protein